MTNSSIKVTTDEFLRSKRSVKISHCCLKYMRGEGSSIQIMIMAIKSLSLAAEGQQADVCEK